MRLTGAEWKGEPMSHSTSHILTTHVGSLIRPPELLALIEAKQDGQPVDDAASPIAFVSPSPASCVSRRRLGLILSATASSERPGIGRAT
jgi:hypothetical protein